MRARVSLVLVLSLMMAMQPSWAAVRIILRATSASLPTSGQDRNSSHRHHVSIPSHDNGANDCRSTGGKQPAPRGGSSCPLPGACALTAVVLPESLVFHYTPLKSSVPIAHTDHLTSVDALPPFRPPIS